MLVNIKQFSGPVHSWAKRHQALAARIHKHNTQAASIVHARNQGAADIPNPCNNQSSM
jgi:hypothetical protein